MKNSATLRRFVRQRALDNCEYCGLAQSSFTLIAFHVEHVVAKQHRGSDELDNFFAIVSLVQPIQGAKSVDHSGWRIDSSV